MSDFVEEQHLQEIARLDGALFKAIQRMQSAERILAAIAEEVRADPIPHESAYDLASEIRRILDHTGDTDA